MTVEQAEGKKIWDGIEGLEQIQGERGTNLCDSHQKNSSPETPAT